MNKKNNVGTALVRKVCPVCLQIAENESEILLNQILTPEYAAQVEEIHNKVVGYTKTMCEKCKEDLKEGFSYLIEMSGEDADENMSFGDTIERRTGRVAMARKSIFKDSPNGDYFFITENFLNDILSRIEDNEESD